MKQTTGFTLIELLVTMLIVGILAAIVYPSYQDQVIKARRTDAKAALMVAAQSLERCYTEYNAYNNVACAVSTSSGEGYYSIAVSGLTSTTYLLTAKTLGVQQNDKECTSLSVDQTNLRTATGSNSSVCW